MVLRWVHGGPKGRPKVVLRWVCGASKVGQVWVKGRSKVGLSTVNEIRWFVWLASHTPKYVIVLCN